MTDSQLQDATGGVPFSRVVVHPLTLLSVVDHYTRVNKDVAPRRVVGVLLGSVAHGVVQVLSSYAVPFEEDGDVWFLDHNFHEKMSRMCRKVNSKEVVVGWYSSGPKIRSVDLQINELMSKYTQNPIFLIVDVNPDSKQLALPMEAYVAVEDLSSEVRVDEAAGGKVQSRMKFSHLPYEVGTLIAEEIGVEHLLRDIPGRVGNGTLSEQIANKERALRALQGKLAEVKEYLTNVVEGRLPPNQLVLDSIQDMFNMLPKVADTRQYARSFTVESNDMMSAIYLGALTRAVIALHQLILNKYEFTQAELKQEAAAKKRDTSAGAKPAEDSKKEVKKKEERKEEGKDSSKMN